MRLSTHHRHFGDRQSAQGVSAELKRPVIQGNQSLLIFVWLKIQLTSSTRRA